MKTYRIGVLADTHAPEYWPALPREIPSIFRGVDLIFHLGDITDQRVLRDLSATAPVVAVRGDHDHSPLPAKTVVPVGGMRIGLIHGKQALWRELAGRLAARVSDNHNPWWNGMLNDAVGAFEDVDAILFGHIHRPHMAWHNGILLFCPGAVFQRSVTLAEAELAGAASLRRRLALRRWLAQARRVGSDAANPPTVGLLTIAGGKIQAEVRALTPVHPPSAPPTRPPEHQTQG